MNKRILALSLVGLLALSRFALPTLAQYTTPTPPPSAAQPPATTAKDKKEKHPAIRAAIRALDNAKTDMQHAAHDFGGHRVAALAACDKAMAELQQALPYDK